MTTKLKAPFSLPAEWHPQDAVLFTWPHQETDWQPILAQVEPIYVQLVKTITRFQSVVLVCHNLALQQNIKQQLIKAQINLAAINWVITPTNDTWARDHGPITLLNGHQIKALNYTFNGWGNKFEAGLDNQINSAIFKQLNIQFNQDIPLVLEGGAIESDGQGVLMVTSECLLNPNRNPSLTKQTIETQLLNQLGLKKMLWLEHGALAGDDTDAHIDTLARFAPDNQIIFQGCTEPNDPHYLPLNAMKKQLKEFKNSNGQNYQLVELPWPEPQFNAEGEQLPATYANFLIINQAVLLPVYGVKQDEMALTVMQSAFKNHQIIPINCRALIEQFGSLHCISMQLPKGFLSHYLS